MKLPVRAGKRGALLGLARTGSPLRRALLTLAVYIAGGAVVWLVLSHIH